MPARDAQGVAAVEDALPFALAIAFLRQLDLQRVLAFVELADAHLQPGDLAEKIDLHQVGGQFLGRNRLPVAVVDAPGERRADELETDPVPDLVLSSLREGEQIPEQNALGGNSFLDFVGIDGDVQPFVAGEKVLVAPAGDVRLDIHRGRFALDPHIFGRVFRPHDRRQQKQGQER